MINNQKPNDAYLGFIQNSISRMGQNSFQTKTWCITLVAALLAYMFNKNDKETMTTCVLISMVIVVPLCSLDMYYLYLERGYRKLYKVAAGLIQDDTVKDYCMSVPKSERGFTKYLNSFLSFSTGGFYTIFFVGQIIVLVFILKGGI